MIGRVIKIKRSNLGNENTVEAEVIRHVLQTGEEKVEKPVRERKAHAITGKSGGHDLELDQLISKLRFSSQEVKDVPGFKKIADELAQKAERFENQSFTVALFGAFSAGKSSFANALLGERFLPVSPNPTTAAINKIMPIDAEHPHGMVLVKLKSLDTLMGDVNRSLAAFDKKADTIDSAISSAQQLLGNETM